MKKRPLILLTFVALLGGCFNQDDVNKRNVTPSHVIDESSKGRVIYKGQLYNSIDALEPFFIETSVLFNDYSNDKNLDYLFDSTDDLYQFIESKYSVETVDLMIRHYTEKHENVADVVDNDAEASARTRDSWSDFSLQFYDTYCNTSNLLCFLNPIYFPQGQMNDIKANGCNYYAKSFGVRVPTNGQMALTYYRLPNCSSTIDATNPYCIPSVRTVLFTPGSYCVDVKFGSCLRSAPGLFLSKAASVKWSCTRN